MKNKRLLKAIPFVTILLVVASVAVFFVNNGFVHSDYTDFVKVQVSGDNTDAFLDKLQSTNGLIEIDRVNKYAYFQNVDTTNVEETLNNAKNDLQVTTFTQNVYANASRKDKVINIAFVSVLISAIFVGFSYVLKTRLYSWDLRHYLKFYGMYILDSVASLTILAGLISLLSLVYKVNDYVLYSFFVLLFVKTLIYWFKFLQEDIFRMKSAYVLNFYNDAKKITGVMVVLLGLAAIGLGVKSIVPFAAIIVALIMGFVSDYSLLTFELPRFKRTLSNKTEDKKEHSKPANQPPAEKKYIPDPRFKKKNKKKK